MDIDERITTQNKIGADNQAIQVQLSQEIEKMKKTIASSMKEMRVHSLVQNQTRL